MQCIDTHSNLGLPPCTRATRYFAVAGSEQRKLLGTGVSDRLHELVYNQGLVLLHLKKPREAHKCFKTGLLFSAQQSYAWLRLAECCIQDHWQQRTVVSQPENATIAKLFGKAQNRKYILKQAFQNTQMKGPLSLGLAISYLNNALHLLARKPEPDTKEVVKKASSAKPAATNATATTVASTATSPMQTAECGVLRCHALANIAYAYLGTGNMHEALRYAQLLLAETGCPGSIRYAGVQACTFSCRPGSLGHLRASYSRGACFLAQMCYKLAN